MAKRTRKAKSRAKGSGDGTESETLTDEAGGPVGNASARMATIRKGFDDILAIDIKIAWTTKRYLDGLKEERTKLWRQLKADTQIPRKILAPQYASYKIVAEAEANRDDDEAAADAARDNTQVVVEALHKFQQLELFPGIGG